MPTPHTSHQTAGADADDRRLDEGAEAEVQDLQEAEAAEARESYIAELTPEAAEAEAEEKPTPPTMPSSEVESERRRLDKTLAKEAEEKELPSFEEATEAVPGINNLKGLYRFAKVCKKAKLINMVHFARSKWMAVPHKEAEDQGASTALANLFNEHRRNFVAELKEKRKSNRRNKGRQKPKPKQAPKADEAKEVSEAEVLKAAIERVNSFTDYEELEKFVYQTLAKNGLLKKDLREDYTVTPVEDFEGSEELCEAVMSKKAELRPAYLEITRKRKRLSAALGDIAGGRRR